MAAATFANIGTMSFSSGTSVVTWPTHQSGDLGILFVETANQAPTGTWPPTGWTLIGTPTDGGSGTTGTRLYVLWKRATSSGETAPTIGDPGDHFLAVIMTVQGALESGNPIGDSASNAGVNPGVGDWSNSFTTLSTTSSDWFIILAASRDNDNASAHFSAWSCNSLVTWPVERFDGGNTVNNGGGIGIATGVKASAGALGNAYVTVNGSLSPMSMFCSNRCIGILPAAGVSDTSGLISAVASSF